MANFLSARDEARKMEAAEAAAKALREENARVAAGYAKLFEVFTNEKLWEDIKKVSSDTIYLTLTEGGIETFIEGMDNLCKSVIRIDEAEVYKITTGNRTIAIVSEAIFRGEFEDLVENIVEELEGRSDYQ